MKETLEHIQKIVECEIEHLYDDKLRLSDDTDVDYSAYRDVDSFIGYILMDKSLYSIVPFEELFFIECIDGEENSLHIEALYNFIG